LKRVATGILCFFSTAASFAACSATIPVPKELKDSDSVIIGTVESSRLVPQSWDTLDGTEYVVHIDQKVKGKQSGEIKIFIEHTDDSVVLQSGTRYIFFLTNTNQHWMINKCGNTAPMDEAGDTIKKLIHAAGND
jgi:hypothetical protein